MAALALAANLLPFVLKSKLVRRSAANFASDFIDKISGNEEEKEILSKRAQELNARGELERMLTVKQDSISDDPFRTRWRPWLGWICGAALVLHLVLFPFVTFCFVMASWFFGDFTYPIMPELDTTTLMGVLGLLLGAVVTRGVEKHKEKKLTL